MRIFIILAIIVAAGCSSDPDTPLGTEFLDDGILGSKPGEVFQDTLVVQSGDLSFAVGSRLDKNKSISLGLDSGYRSSIALKVNFAAAGTDSDRTVERAYLRLRVVDVSQSDSLTARFYEFLTEYSEGDTLETLDINLTPIPDSSLVTVDREMRFAISQYTLPPSLVQAWIRGDAEHKGIAILFEGSQTGKQLDYGSRENADGSLHPFMKVIFTDGESSNYPVSDDGTYVLSESSTSNLIISDGYIRRILIPVDLSQIASELLIHDARLILNLVPGTDLGSEFNMLLYSPDSSDPADVKSRSGQNITSTYVNFVSGQVVLSVRNILSLYLTGARENTGFALRFLGEGGSIRQAEFYTSASDSLGPRLILTASEPPVFAK
ncbi:MAG: hypothetical protein ABIA59_11200 [Candidatus Latescibacterota bacterium]